MLGATLAGMSMPPQMGRWVPSSDFAASDTAKNTREAARASAEMNERVGALVLAMEEQLRIAKQAQLDAERSERFTRVTAVLSLVVSVASLAAAVGAIFVSLAVTAA